MPWCTLNSSTIALCSLSILMCNLVKIHFSCTVLHIPPEQQSWSDGCIDRWQCFHQFQLVHIHQWSSYHDRLKWEVDFNLYMYTEKARGLIIIRSTKQITRAQHHNSYYLQQWSSNLHIVDSGSASMVYNSKFLLLNKWQQISQSA